MSISFWLNERKENQSEKVFIKQKPSENSLFKESKEGITSFR